MESLKLRRMSLHAAETKATSVVALRTTPRSPVVIEKRQRQLPQKNQQQEQCELQQQQQELGSRQSRVRVAPIPTQIPAFLKSALNASKRTTQHIECVNAVDLESPSSNDSSTTTTIVVIVEKGTASNEETAAQVQPLKKKNRTATSKRRTTTNNDTNTQQQQPSCASSSLSSTTISPKQRCVFGCVVNSTQLYRFPVNDQKRCNNWLRFFGIEATTLRNIGGLANLRVCLQHFTDAQRMAKTRMKTTPTRLQKEALASVGMVTTAIPVVSLEHSIKKRFRSTDSTGADEDHRQRAPSSTIIVAAPKRTNSISSAASTVSHLSDIQSGGESSPLPATPPPPPPSSQAQTQAQALLPVKTLNQNQPASAMNVLNGAQHALKNRKVFVITEKREESEVNGATTQSNANGGQKRKMYLIMEENDPMPTNAITPNGGVKNDAEEDGIGMANRTKSSKMELRNTIQKRSTKKLTLFANKSDGPLKHKFEKILPEILNCIEGASTKAGINRSGSSPGNAAPPALGEVIKKEPDEDSKRQRSCERLPITLPPKKNRSKNISMALNSGGNKNDGHSIITNGNGATHHLQQQQQLQQVHQPPARQQQHKVVVATPGVIVSAPNSVASRQQCNGHSNRHSNVPQQSTILRPGTPKATNMQQQPVANKQQQQSPPQKNINLSADFLFLMKMLPKLESIPETHKSHVRACIENIIVQNSSH